MKNAVYFILKAFFVLKIFNPKTAGRWGEGRGVNFRGQGAPVVFRKM